MGVLVQMINNWTVNLQIIRPLQAHTINALVKLDRQCFLVQSLVLKLQLLIVFVLGFVSNPHSLHKLSVAVRNCVNFFFKRVLKL